MKKRKVKRAILGDERTFKMFLLVPKTLGLADGYEQTRFLEVADVVQTYDGAKWNSVRWKEQGGIK